MTLYSIVTESSLTRDGTWAPCIGTVESQSFTAKEIPVKAFRVKQNIGETESRF